MTGDSGRSAETSSCFVHGGFTGDFCPKCELHIFLADPTGQIERECADKVFKQKDVALTYALAIRDEKTVPVDWPRVNAAILKRWPRGLARVKELAWKRFK